MEMVLFLKRRVGGTIRYDRIMRCSFQSVWELDRVAGNMLKSIRNSLVVTSVLYVVMGAVLMAFPEDSLKLACALIGVVTLIYAAVRILSYFKDGGAYANRFDLFLGVLLGVVGVFLLLCPQLIVSLIPIALGIYIVVDSFAAMKKALDMKTLGFDKWWISFVVALVLTVFGAVMIFNPFDTAASLVVFIGWSFIFDGAYTLVNTIIASRIYGR